MHTDSEAGTERDLLEAHLDGNRADVPRKARGLTWELATTRLGPSPTSVAGIVKHLVDVERWWFRHYLLGEDGVPLHSSDDDPDAEFEMEPGDTLESLLGEYDVACAESRTIAAGLDLSDRCVRARRDGRHPSLRWVYLHMIEEVARHNGHLDIYRELLDGTTDREETTPPPLRKDDERVHDH